MIEMPKLPYTKPKVSMAVDTREGKILGWEKGDQFTPLGENCCENPLECKRCFERAEPWWARWRR